MAGVTTGKKRPGRPLGSTKALKYAEAVASGLPKNKAAAIAGYSPKNTTIEHIPSVRHALATVEQHRETLQSSEGYSLPDIAQRLKNRATNAKIPAGVQTDNDKVLINILGYNAPQQVSIRSTSLLMEFSDLTAADLAAIKDKMQADDL